MRQSASSTTLRICQSPNYRGRQVSHAQVGQASISRKSITHGAKGGYLNFIFLLCQILILTVTDIVVSFSYRTSFLTSPWCSMKAYQLCTCLCYDSAAYSNVQNLFSVQFCQVWNPFWITARQSCELPPNVYTLITNVTNSYFKLNISQIITVTWCLLFTKTKFQLCTICRNVSSNRLAINMRHIPERSPLANVPKFMMKRVSYRM